jgi:hypothetical protein
MDRLAGSLELALDCPLSSLEGRQRPAATNEEEMLRPRERATDLDTAVTSGSEKPLEIVTEPGA